MTNKMIDFDIQGMTCDSCATHVERALRDVEGVMNVNVPGWDSHQAHVTVNEDADLDAIAEAVS